MAAQAATGGPAQPINVVADAGYSNGDQAEACQAKGTLPHVPANRSVNNHGDGTLSDRRDFTYQPESNGSCARRVKPLLKQLSRKDRAVPYAAQPEVCGACSLKTRCTVSSRRMITRHLHEEALRRMQQRAMPEAMRLRRSTVERPFANLNTASSDIHASCCVRSGERKRKLVWEWLPTIQKECKTFSVDAD